MEKEIQYGVSTVNEWRVSREDKAPINGGDIAFMSCNVAPIDSPKIKGEISSEKDELPKTNEKHRVKSNGNKEFYRARRTQIIGG